MSARKPADKAPDLHTQLEELLDQVWECEAEWRLDDKIDLALHIKRAR